MNVLNQSIHPRVVNGKTAHPKVNTSKRKQRVTVARIIDAISQHLERHPRDAVSKKHLSKLEGQIAEMKA
jgi:hypothetical protein